MLLQEVWDSVKARNPHEVEFLQAVEEVLSTAGPVFARKPEYLEIMKQICEPERMLMFRVRTTPP